MNELTAMPCGSPPTKAASAATPVGKVPKTRRKQRGSSDCVKVIGPPIGSVCFGQTSVTFLGPAQRTKLLLFLSITPLNPLDT